MDEKRKRIQKYFSARFPKWAVVMILIGVLMLLGGMSAKSGGTIVMGLLLAGIGGYGIYNYTQVPTDQQIDEWTAQDLRALDGRALAKSGVDQSEIVGDPVTITGPGDFEIWKVGADRVLRFGRISSATINFTPNQLLVYSCVVDITTGNTLKESTDEYFYRDVVSVSTKTRDGQIGSFKFQSGEYFTLTTSGGTSVEVFLQDPSIGQRFGGQMPTTAAERAIQTIRKMLREKKVSPAIA